MSPIFQSTRPLRGETHFSSPFFPSMSFSIHSPLAGRDRCDEYGLDLIMVFQSTRPLRGETKLTRATQYVAWFSIHSPLAGRDTGSRSRCAPRWFFNPLAPCGARPTITDFSNHLRFFNPLAPCGARRYSESYTRKIKAFSIHSPLAGRDFDAQ